MRILVTGGAGFIGSHIVDAYASRGHEVAVLDNFATGKRANLEQSQPKLYEADIADSAEVSKVVQDFRPDLISHHAAQVSVVYSVAHPTDDLHKNVVGTVNVIDAARL